MYFVFHFNDLLLIARLIFFVKIMGGAPPSFHILIRCSSTAYFTCHGVMTMRKLARAGILSTLFFAAATAAWPQQPAAQQNDQNTQSLGDAARKQRELKEQQARTAGNNSSNAQQGSTSLGDVAHQQQEKRLQEVRTSLADSRKLFASIDEVLEFATKETGFAKHTAVKHQLIGESQVKRQFAQNISDSENAQRLARSELVLKKFGLLPNNFDLKTFLLSASPRGLGAFYDPKTKMVNLLNWIEISEQLPILAHELTHVLQDQNYDLERWRGYTKERRSRPPKMRVDSGDDEEGIARTAVVEGQAQIVYFDYLLKPHDKSLLDTPEYMDFLQEAVNHQSYNTVSVHNEPLLLKETGIFPYREGLNFELELLRTGGKPMAFGGVFARPPRDTHDILEPNAYITNQKRPADLMPDLTGLLADKYEAYDSGIIGQLDVRVMARQFGREDDAATLPPNWQGGAYVAVKRITATEKPVQLASSEKPALAAGDKSILATGDKSLQTVQTTSAKPVLPAAAGQQAPASIHDLALLYVSRWKTAEAAERFVQIYKSSLTKRVTILATKTSESNCTGESPSCGPISAARITTDDGLIVIEVWPKNLVLISHSFDEPTVNRLRQAVLFHTANKSATSTAELNQHLFALPEFQAFEEEMGQEIYSAIAQFGKESR